MDLDVETREALGFQETWFLAAGEALAWRSAELDQKRRNAAAGRILKRSEFIPCPGCGKDFERRPKGWLRSFCSDTCRVKHHNEELRAARAAKVDRPTHCRQCAQPITQDLTSRARNFCNAKCSKRYKKSNPT
jgi:endogenous inhibitor of DNA gyrase (YacG/DUF329 family)